MTQTEELSEHPKMGASDLLNIEFDITPSEKGRVNKFTGHLIRGAFLNLLKQVDPDVVNRLHDGRSMRPYSIAPVRFSREARMSKHLWRLRPGQKLTFRLSSLSKEVNTSLLEAVMKLSNEPVRIGYTHCDLVGVRYETASFTELVKQVGNSRRFIYHFLSPTKFEIRAQTFPMLFPIPTYMFGSLGKLWNKFAPESAHIDIDDVIDDIKSNVCVVGHRIKTVRVRIKSNIPITGFIGKTWFKVAREAQEKTRSVAALLSSFAPFAGVGAKRSFGCGAVDVEIP